MATTRKTTARKKAVGKKAPAKNTAPKQGTRSSKHGNVTYFSVAKENPECYKRCSPPYRHVDKPTGTRTTLVRYSHRNLTITSPGMSAEVKPQAKKAPAKKTAVKKAPAKKTAVKKAPVKTAQCGCAVSPAKKVTAKNTPFKAPASWTVPNVGGVFRGPVQTQVSKTVKARAALNRLIDEMEIARVIRPDGTKRLYDQEDIYDEMPIMALIRIANNPPESLCLINQSDHEAWRGTCGALRKLIIDADALPPMAEMYIDW